jgi:hypothetical protein
MITVRPYKLGRRFLGALCVIAVAAEATAMARDIQLGSRASPDAGDQWSMVRALKPQTELRVTLANGSSFEARFVTAGSDALMVDNVKTGSAGLRLPAPSVSGRVELRRSELQTVERKTPRLIVYGPNQWENVLRLRPRTRVRVTAGGDVWIGRLVDITQDALSVGLDGTATNQVRRVSRTDVSRIEVAGKRRQLGAGIGAAVGGALAAWLIGAAAANADRVHGPLFIHNYAMVIIPAGIGAGAGIGALIDAARRREMEPVYIAQP